MKKLILASMLFIMVFVGECFACNCVHPNHGYRFYHRPQFPSIERYYNRDYRYPQSYNEVLYIQKMYERGRYR